MKMKLQIPDTVFRQAKSASAKRGISLRQFVAEALCEKLKAPSSSVDKPWMKSFGKLRHLHKETARINQLMRKNPSRLRDLSVLCRTWKTAWYAVHLP
jgi:hypothetical protein